MLLIHYISIMMQIFYIDWHQHWECDRTMNIGANAHGKWMVSNKTATSDRLNHCWPLGFQWHRRGIELIFKSLDCFTMRLFTTIFLCYIRMYLLFESSPGWLPGWRVFILLFFFLCVCVGGGLTSIWWGSTQLQCNYYLVPYTDL